MSDICGRYNHFRSGSASYMLIYAKISVIMRYGTNMYGTIVFHWECFDIGRGITNNRDYLIGL